MVYALHMFSASYVAGGVKISEAPEGAPADGTTTISKGDASEGADQMVAPKRPQCPPEQKQKVMNSINAYVQAAPAPPPPGSPPAP
jgi:hypothetical protein